MLNVLKDTLKRNVTWKPVFCFVCCLMLFLLLCLQTCRAYIYLHTFHYFLTQNPKQRSKDQKQVRVDLQGMHTSLTRLHLSLTFKVKNTHTEQHKHIHTHTSKDSGVFGSCPWTVPETHTHLSVSVCQWFSRCHMMSKSMWLVQGDQTHRSILPENPYRWETHPEVMSSVKYRS